MRFNSDAAATYVQYSSVLLTSCYYLNSVLLAMPPSSSLAQQVSSVYQAPYSPSALRSFTNSGSCACTLIEISSECFACWFNVHSDSNHQLQDSLHKHFCTNKQDRGLAYSDGLCDIWDMVRFHDTKTRSCY